MRGDFSRLALGGPPASRVMQQQGRVLLDADWNDAVAVLLNAQRALAADLIGPHGGPADRTAFAISLVETEGRPDLSLGGGVYYVDGIRVELPNTSGNGLLWSQQPYAPWPEPPDLPAEPYLVYLDVWERHVVAMQDNTMREVALGGPDTTSRAEIVWQIRAEPAGDELLVGCREFPIADWRRAVAGGSPRLRTWAQRVDDDDPCLADPDAGYRGVENQLYRVEITDVHPDGARFVWSRENGSVVAAWNDIEGDRLLLDGVRDAVRGFAPGDWLELTWDELEYAGASGPRVRVVAVDARGVTFDENTATGPVPANPRQLTHPIARRWDARPRTGVTMVGGAIDIVESDGDSQRIPLEDGIFVQFAVPADGADPSRYRVGDYWTIPARVATGDISWPRDAGEPLAVPAHGVEHHYAPLGVVSGGDVTELRRSFAPVAVCQ